MCMCWYYFYRTIHTTLLLVQVVITTIHPCWLHLADRNAVI